MAKGSTCPNCGAQMWHKGRQGGRLCKSCGARGWLGGERPTGGGGKGKACENCQAKKLVMVDDGKPEIRFCTSCSLVLVLPN